MKKLIISFLLLSAQSIVLGQQQTPSITDMEKQKIIQASDRALDTWAPGYNRKYGTPAIDWMNAEKLAQSIDKNSITSYRRLSGGYNPDSHISEQRYLQDKKSLEWVGKVLEGREYYIVTYMYDKNVEIFSNGYAAQLFIWADDHAVFRIFLGDGPLLPNLDDPDYECPGKRVVRYKPRLK